MRNQSSIDYRSYVLSPEDTWEKEELFYRVCTRVLEKGTMPEMDLKHLDTYVESLLGQTEDTNVYVMDDSVDATFCSAFLTDRDPHVYGKGLYLALMLNSGGNPRLTTRLVLNMRKFAKLNNCDWLAVHHRTAELTYRCKYTKLKDK